MDAKFLGDLGDRTRRLDYPLDGLFLKLRRVTPAIPRQLSSLSRRPNLRGATVRKIRGGLSIAETAFIGGENLFIEGISDQVYISGMNARLLRAGTPPSQCLDLNQVTLVPGGSNMPYMLYLARGRDQHKPACAVLLDSDAAGQNARNQIRKGGAKGKPTVADDLIVMIGEWAAKGDAKTEPGVTIEEPEDLVPLTLAGIAARRYATSLLGLSETQAAKLTDKAIQSGINADNASMWNAVEAAFGKTFKTSIGKAGFAKELLAHLHELDEGKDEASSAAVAVLDANFASLIKQLGETLQLARERELESRRDRRVERTIEEFANDHPDGCMRDTASAMLRRIDAAADDTRAGDMIRAGTAALRRDFSLAADPLGRVPEYQSFLEELRNLPVLVRLGDQGRLTTEELTKE